MENQPSNRSKAKSTNLNSTTDCSKMLLTKKGVRQAVRNHSCSIWSIFSTQDCECSLKLQFDQPSKQLNPFQTSKDQSKGKQFILSNRSQKINYQSEDRIIEKDMNSNNISSRNNQKVKADDKKQSTFENKEKTFSKQTQQIKKAKRQVVKTFLAKQIPYTRQLSNTAFAKFYNKPCCQNYGFKNVKQNEFLYKNYMKTHNLTPHTLKNNPQQYQTYTSALNHGKRTKLDTQAKWKQIQRQLAKQLNLNQYDVQKLDSQNTNIQSQKIKPKSTQKYNQSNLNKKRSKSQEKIKSNNDKNKDRFSTLNTTKQVLFLYKHTDQQGNTITAKDRHGINCYVDNGFAQNEQAYTNFLKQKNPIYPQKVKKQDKNIDKIRIQNHIKSVQEDLPKHYLMPCVQYDWKKYSFRKNKNKSE